MTPERKQKNRQKKYRKRLLKNVLPEYGLQYRGDSKLLNNFVKGKINCSIIKIVNIMKKAEYRHNQTDYDAKYDEYGIKIQETANQYLEDGMPPVRARKAANRLWRDRILKEIFEENGGYENIPVVTRARRTYK